VAAAIFLACYFIDLATKTLALSVLDPSEPIPILGGVVVFRLLRNTGAAFSMGEGMTVALTCLALAATAVICLWLIPRVRNWGWTVVSGLLLAGVVGNLTDRLLREPGPFHGAVIDFIQIPYFAVFNFADICITFAAIILVYLAVWKQRGISQQIAEPAQTPGTSQDG
jgi:signal peptidase II